MQAIGDLKNMKVMFSHVIGFFFFWGGGGVGIHVISVCIGVGALIGYNMRISLGSN